MIALFLFCFFFVFFFTYITMYNQLSLSLSQSWPICEVAFLVKNPIKIHYISDDMIFSRKSLAGVKFFSHRIKRERERETVLYQIHTPQNRHLIWLNANQAIIHIPSISLSQWNWKKKQSPTLSRNLMESLSMASPSPFFSIIYFKKETKKTRNEIFRFLIYIRGLKYKSDKNKTSLN